MRWLSPGVQSLFFTMMVPPPWTASPAAAHRVDVYKRQMEACPENEYYLRTKKEKMEHMLHCSCSH